MVNDIKEHGTLNSLNQAERSTAKSYGALSSGKKNRADNVAGFTIADLLNAEAAVLKVASYNKGFGDSAAAIADGALSQISGLEELRLELATQASSGQYTDQQRAVLNEEYQALGAEITRIQETAVFNDKNVVQESLNLQIGADSSANSQLGYNPRDLSALNAPSSIATVGEAQAALDAGNDRVALVAQARGDIGAFQARANAAEQSIESRQLALRESESKITDVDVAEELANLTRSKILQQQGTALLAQVGQINAKRAQFLLS